MTPTRTAEATGEHVPARIPLPGDPEDALIDEARRDLRLRAALADRLTFKGALIQTGTESYWLKATKTAHHAARRP
ncbi:hypothetical protein ACFU7T_11025 [Streptomyces sp. NPDC057555]|uniref:hypothetical protein n=1 Tax=Streptomyces sp. NPDC057555 TaxID=3346166 RepID=UPI0036784747